MPIEIIDYSVYTTPFKDLPCLEDAIQKGYSTEDEQNKTVSLRIRGQLSAVNYAISSLIRQGNSNYYSVIQRHAIYYAVSILKKDIEAITNKKREIEENGTVEELELKFSEQNLQLLGPTSDRPSHVYMPYWCSEWINSNSDAFGLSTKRFAVFLLVCALNKSTITNQNIKSEIHKNTEWFMKYIQQQKNRYNL